MQQAVENQENPVLTFKIKYSDGTEEDVQSRMPQIDLVLQKMKISNATILVETIDTKDFRYFGFIEDGEINHLFNVIGRLIKSEYDLHNNPAKWCKNHTRPLEFKGDFDDTDLPL